MAAVGALAALAALAERLNAPDELKGAVFGRRFAEISILDDDALVERVAHPATNPVDANLVSTHRGWTGLVTFAGRVPPSEGTSPRSTRIATATRTATPATASTSDALSSTPALSSP